MAERCPTSDPGGSAYGPASGRGDMEDHVQHHARRIRLCRPQVQLVKTLKIHAPRAVWRFCNDEFFYAIDTLGRVAKLTSFQRSEEGKEVMSRRPTVSFWCC